LHLFAHSLLDLHPHNKFTPVPNTASVNSQNNLQDTQIRRKPYKMCDEPPWSCFDLEEEAAVDAFGEQQSVPRVHWRDGGVAPACPDSIRSDLAIPSIPEDELEPHFSKVSKRPQRHLSNFCQDRENRDSPHSRRLVFPCRRDHHASGPLSTRLTASSPRFPVPRCVD
jgi:hypothetical protein